MREVHTLQCLQASLVTIVGNPGAFLNAFTDACINVEL